VVKACPAAVKSAETDGTKSLRFPCRIPDSASEIGNSVLAHYLRLRKLHGRRMAEKAAKTPSRRLLGGWAAEAPAHKVPGK
jgi:hypothetical protein